jgi:hypothetical protein
MIRPPVVGVTAVQAHHTPSLLHAARRSSRLLPSPVTLRTAARVFLQYGSESARRQVAKPAAAQNGSRCGGYGMPSFARSAW